MGPRARCCGTTFVRIQIVIRVLVCTPALLLQVFRSVDIHLRFSQIHQYEDSRHWEIGKSSVKKWSGFLFVVFRVEDPWREAKRRHELAYETRSGG